MIEVENLTFRYIGRREPTLRQVSFTCPAGELLLVMGPSGCGKSTLGLCLTGAIPHSISGEMSGRVRVGGMETAQVSMADMAQRVGLVFQDPEAQFCMLQVADEVAFGLENLAVPTGEMDARIDEALDQVGLSDRRAERIERLSGGQKQRLALACVLAQRPTVLVLDEPTAQLDPGGASELIALLEQLRSRRRHTIVLVEHRLDDVMHLVDRALVLAHDGSVTVTGHPREVLQVHGAKLISVGVWVPQVSELACALETEGVQLDPFPLTVGEAAETLAARLVAAGPERREAASLDAHQDRSRPRGTWSGEPVVRVDGLSYRYPRARPAVQNVSFSVCPGELVALAGPNGAGKSTLARLITGILPAPKGTVRLSDGAGPPGYVFQYPEHQFVAATAVEDVAYGPRRRGLTEPQARAQALALLAELGLDRLAEAHPFSLSLGEQRRLSVADMLVLEPKLLILDEPTFGQDRSGAEKLLELMQQVAQAGGAVLAITHDVKLMAQSQRVLVLVGGRLTFDGPPRELFDNEAILSAANLAPPPLWQLSARLSLPTRLLDVEELVALWKRLARPVERRGAAEVVRLARS
jgi:energy-coupling factor transport system ATP-binding protein